MQAYQVLDMLIASGYDKDDLLINTYYDLPANKNYLTIANTKTKEVIAKFSFDACSTKLILVETKYPELFI